MTGNEVHRLEIVLTRIEGKVEAIQAENAEGKIQHGKFDTRISALEQFRWRIAGAWAVIGLVLGAGGGVGVTILIG